MQVSANSSTISPDSHNVRERILTAAGAEFATHGLRGTSVRSIGARAGVTAAMVNYYYGSKRALYDMVVEQAQARLFARVAAAVTDSTAPDLPARLAGAYFDFLSEDNQFQRLLVREVIDRGDSVPVFVRKYVAPLRAMFEDLFGPGDAAFQTAISLFGAVAGYFLYEPIMTELTGADAMSKSSLARRRRHVVELAMLLAREQL